jgi:DNA-binding transcriptional ArsR family regulator
MDDAVRLRARATFNPPWGSGRALRSGMSGGDRALSWIQGADRLLFTGRPWSGRTTALIGIGRRLALEGVPPERLGWAELGHPLWADVTARDLLAAFSDLGGPTALVLDDVPIDQLTWIERYRGPVRVFATTSQRADGVRALPPWTLWHAARSWGLVAPEPRGASPADLIEATFRGHDQSDTLRDPLRTYLTLGGFPALLAGDGELGPRVVAAQHAHRAWVLDPTLYRRIPRDAGVREPHQLDRLLTALGDTPGALLSPTHLGAQLGVTQPTLDKHLAALDAAGLVVQLPAWSPDGKARGRRVFLADGALRGATRLLGARLLTDPDEVAHLLVHAIVSHAVAWADAAGVTIGHWRSGRNEVDLVIDHPEHPVALQLDASRRASFDGLYALADAHPRFKDRLWVLLHRAPPTHPAHHPTGIGRLPTVPFLATLGAVADVAAR